MSRYIARCVLVLVFTMSGFALQGGSIVYSHDVIKPSAQPRRTLSAADKAKIEALLATAAQVLRNNAQFPINDSLAAITPSQGNSWIAKFPDPATATELARVIIILN